MSASLYHLSLTEVEEHAQCLAARLYAQGFRALNAWEHCAALDAGAPVECHCTAVSTIGDPIPRPWAPQWVAVAATLATRVVETWEDGHQTTDMMIALTVATLAFVKDDPDRQQAVCVLDNLLRNQNPDPYGGAFYDLFQSWGWSPFEVLAGGLSVKATWRDENESQQ